MAQLLLLQDVFLSECLRTSMSIILMIGFVIIIYMEPSWILVYWLSWWRPVISERLKLKSERTWNLDLPWRADLSLSHKWEVVISWDSCDLLYMSFTVKKPFSHRRLLLDASSSLQLYRKPISITLSKLLPSRGTWAMVHYRQWMMAWCLPGQMVSGLETDLLMRVMKAAALEEHWCRLLLLKSTCCASGDHPSWISLVNTGERKDRHGCDGKGWNIGRHFLAACSLLPTWIRGKKSQILSGCFIHRFARFW